jgi:serine/threonine protein kinase
MTNQENGMQAGQTVSHYRIIEKLGEGGMGVVYKAEDTNLDRFVALKFLPPGLASSEQDKARFRVEAKAAAALNHPNVCSIIEIAEHDGNMFLVMEFVDGVTLREKETSISFKQAVDLGIQIADGLAAAHEKGVVHRDIKPENIMIRKDGIAQIMDFGLAKLRASGSKITRLTKQGSTVGTAGYMSPEQVQGQDTDHRSDIFSYGVLLYELLTGQLPFKGAHEMALAYEIVNVDPAPMSGVKPEIDPALDTIVMECLAKEPSERCQSVAEVAKDLRRYKRESSKQHLSRSFPAQSGIRNPGAAQPTPVAVPKPGSSILPWAIVGGLLLITVFLLFRELSGTTNPWPVLVASLVEPDSIYVHSFGQAAGPPVISPDGKNIAFSGVTPDGVVRLYVRSMHENVTRALEKTDNAQYPFWSPDGRNIGFFADGKLKKIDVGGGSPITICDAANNRGGTWSSSGTILFGPDYQSPIYHVSSDGGKAAPVTRIDTTRNESSHRWPFALPDGKHFLYFSRVSTNSGEAEGHALFGASIDGKENKLIIHTTANAVYASGYLLYLRGTTLVAQQFDQSSLELKGDGAPVAENILSDPGFNLAVFSASETGILLFQQGNVRAGAHLLVTDRSGSVVSTIGDQIEHFRVRFSADGQFITSAIFDPKLLRLNVWDYDLRTGVKERLTSGSGENGPLMSPDGGSIVYNSDRGGVWNLFMKQLHNTSPESHLFSSKTFDAPLDWSRDGSILLFSRSDLFRNTADLWIMQMNGIHNAYPIVNTEFDEGGGRFSPDGKWLAYQSNESGDYEVYVRPVGRGDARSWKVSTNGGYLPVWAGSNNELCYVNRENKVVLLSLRMTNGNLDIAGAKSLFTMPAFLESYDISPDGKRFLINRSLEIQKMAPPTLMVDWDKELKEK